MPLLHRTRNKGGGTGDAMAPSPATPATPAAPVASSGHRRQATSGTSTTRTTPLWTGVVVAAIILIAFIVFILQNTDSVEISFFRMDATLPLAIGLLIALLIGMLIMLLLGAARITQVRRRARGRDS